MLSLTRKPDPVLVRSSPGISLKKPGLFGEKHMSYFRSRRKWGFKSRPYSHSSGRLVRFGNVVVVHDSEFWEKAPFYKPRQAVVLENDRPKRRLVVTPVKHLNGIVPLRNFDGNRHINLKDSKCLPYSHVYSRDKFKNTRSSYLDLGEKIRIKKLLKK